MKCLTMFLLTFLAVGSLTVVQADDTTAKVEGKGIATMTATGDDEAFGAFAAGDTFGANDFRIKCNVDADGSAEGTASFVFGEDFAALWGADIVTLECEVTNGTIDDDGNVVLQGLSIEEDFADGVLIFEEVTPFEIVIDSAGTATLRWCLLPAFELGITKGKLKVK